MNATAIHRQSDPVIELALTIVTMRLVRYPMAITNIGDSLKSADLCFPLHVLLCSFEKRAALESRQTAWIVANHINDSSFLLGVICISLWDWLVLQPQMKQYSTITFCRCVPFLPALMLISSNFTIIYKQSV